MAKPSEHIGVWMNREDLLERQPGHLERVMDDLAGIGVTHLYPEVYFRGGAAYPSGVAPIHGEFQIARGGDGGEASRPDLLARLVELDWLACGCPDALPALALTRPSSSMR